MKNLGTLRLTLHRRWFDMIQTGQKKEEYREIKPFWITRLNKDYTRVEFINGYHTDADRFTVGLKKISVGYGRKDWGAPRKKVFILLLV